MFRKKKILISLILFFGVLAMAILLAIFFALTTQIYY